MSMMKTLMSLAVIAMVAELAMAANYSVGGPGGWDTSSDLKTWASSQLFLVGDNLIFTYSVNHDVVEVPKADYDSCQPNSPIQTYNGGSTVIALDSSGKRYFICGTPGHCNTGMKVEIDTLATTAPPPATPATPPPATPATPPPANPATPPPASSPKSAPRVSPPATPPPASSPKSAPRVSPPSKSPASSPKSSPTAPSNESPVSSLPPSGSTPPPPPSSASKIMVGFTVGLGAVMSMVLNF